MAELRAQAQRLQEEAERERSRQLATEAEVQSELLPLPLPPCVATHAMIISKRHKLQVMMACPWLAGGSTDVVGREVPTFLPFESASFSLGSRSGVVKVICLPVLGGVPSCVFPLYSMQQSLSLSWAHEGWILDARFQLFLSSCCRKNLPSSPYAAKEAPSALSPS